MNTLTNVIALASASITEAEATQWISIFLDITLMVVAGAVFVIVILGLVKYFDACNAAIKVTKQLDHLTIIAESIDRKLRSSKEDK